MYFIYILRTSEGRRARHAAYTSSLFFEITVQERRGARGYARTPRASKRRLPVLGP